MAGPLGAIDKLHMFQVQPVGAEQSRRVGQGAVPFGGLTGGEQRAPQGEGITHPTFSGKTLGLANENNFGPIYGNDINGKENILGAKIFGYA